MATSPHSDQSITIYEQQLREQPAWKEWSNTLVAALGAFAGVATAALDAGLDIPEPWGTVVMAIIAVATTVGISRTPNGRTRQGLEKLRDAQARWIDDHRGCGDYTATPELPTTVATPGENPSDGGRHRLGGLPTGSLG